jgi:hypothetical protein
LIIIFFGTDICKYVHVCLLEVIEQQEIADQVRFEQLSSPLPAAILHRRRDLRSWVQLPAGTFFTTREPRYQNRLVLGVCRTKLLTMHLNPIEGSLMKWYITYLGLHLSSSPASGNIARLYVQIEYYKKEKRFLFGIKPMPFYILQHEEVLPPPTNTSYLQRMMLCFPFLQFSIMLIFSC